MKKILWVMVWIVLGMNSNAQIKMITQHSIENRKRIVGEMPKDPEKEEAEEYAKQYGIPVREIDDYGRIKEIRRIEKDGHPRFFTTDNADAARTVSTDKVWSENSSGLILRGENILVGVWDGGLIRTTHVEFESRVHSIDTYGDIDGHPTHVAGTIGAAGIERKAMGMANQCFIEGYDWGNDNDEMELAARDGLLISNHSYGFIHGFDYNYEEDRWEWHGNIKISTEEDYTFGFYGRDAAIWDETAYDNPYYLIVKSAGNDRLEGPPPGTEHFVWDNGWTESEEDRNKDGGPDGFDCIGSQGTSKNILTVGAIKDIVGGYESPEDVNLSSFSSFGPTDDGRIKPDIVGNGVHLYSTYHNNDTDYDYSNGTSMSAPNVAGSLALLQELHYKLFNRYMKSASLKGVALHTADEAGNMGPDYKFGWGLLNTLNAAEFLISEERLLFEDSITDNTENEYRLYSDGDTAVRITICWTDPRGPEPLTILDVEDLILVNDLDIRLIKLSDSTVYEPFILDPATPDAPAQPGDNFRDNVEQIYLPVSEKGHYKLMVSHKDSITDTIQHYSLFIDGINQVFIAEDSTYLNNNNGFMQVTDAPEYPLNSDFVWLIEPENLQPIRFQFTEFSTDTNDIVTIYDGPDSNSPVLGQFSGSLFNPDTLLNSSGESLFIHFSSSTKSGFKGFALRYCTTLPDESLEILGKENPCHLSSEIYSFGMNPETDYQWSYSNNVNDSVSIDQNTISFLVPEEVFMLNVTPINSCGSGSISSRLIHPLLALPTVNLLMDGDTVPCTNAQTLFSVEEDTTAIYRWVIPEEWLGESDSSSIWITPTANEGTLTVFPSNSCGESEGIELTLHPLPPPSVPEIVMDGSNPCENSTEQFSIETQAEVDYTWSVDPGWEIVGPDTLNLVVVKTGQGITGKVFLNSSNKCGDTLKTYFFPLLPAPERPVLVLQPSVMEGLDEIVLQNYEDYTQINWFRNDSLIPDFHGKSFILHRNGLYSVEVANSAGCMVATEIADRIEMEEKSLIYNIATGSEGLIHVNNDSNKPALITVYDLTGKAVFSDEVLPGTNAYHTTRRGLLIFRIEGSDQTKTQMVFVH